VLLYVLKVERARAKVPSTWLWASAARDLRARAPWKRLTPELLLLLEVLAILALGLALSRPVARSSALANAHYAIVVDASASMSAATGPSGETRFEEALRAARAFVDALPPGAEAMIVEAGREARVASPLDRDKRRLGRAIDDLRPLEVEGDLGAAVALSVDKLRAFDGSRVVVVTDGNLAKPLTLEGVTLPIEVLAVGAPAENLGIVRVEASTAADPDTKAETTEVFAVVASFAKSDREAYVTLREENASDVLASRRILVKAGEEVPVVLAFSPAKGDVGRGLIVDVSPHDALPLDDVAFARVPEGARLPVVLATNRGAESPWLERALASDDDVELSKIAVEDLGAAQGVDRGALVVVDGACPTDPPGGDLLVVHPPKGACIGTAVGDEIEAPVVTSWESGDPRLRFLSFDGVTIARANALEAESKKAELVHGRPSPLVSDISTASRTATLVGFDVGESNWPFKASFVLFVRNVVEEARAHRAHGATNTARTGEPLTLPVPPDVASVDVTQPSGPVLVARVRSGVAVVPSLAHAGLYRASFGGRAPGTVVVPVNLTSRAESDLSSVVSAPASGGVTIRSAKDAPAGYRDLGWILAAVALAFVLFDVHWFTRRPRAGGGAATSRSTPIAPERAAP
jgi:hypothetical protein